MGGGYQAAKPFNTINPSGIGAEESLGTLTAVGEGNRNRAAQAAQQQRAIAAQQQQNAEAMEFQAREAEKDRQLQMKKMQDEQWYRDRSEHLTMLYQDHQEELARINSEMQVAINTGRNDAVVALMRKKDELQTKLSDMNRKISGLELLDQAHKGIFNKDLTDQTGKSMGGALIKGVLNLANGRREKLTEAATALGPAFDRFVTSGERPGDEAERVHNVEEERTESSKPATGKSAWDDVGGKIGRGLKTAGGVIKDFVGTGDLGVALGANGVIGSDERGSSGAEMGPDGQPLRIQTKDYGELAKVLASRAAGTAVPGEVEEKVRTMLESLEKAVSDPAPGAQEASVKHAVDQYKKLKELGADTSVLDKMLWHLWNKSSGSDQVQRAVVGAEKVKDVQAGTSVNPKVEAEVKKLAEPAVRLNKMLTLMSAQMDEGLEGKPRTLLGAWGNDDFYDLREGKVNPGIEREILNIVTVVSGARNPEDMLRRLTDSDPGNDPKELDFVRQLHPEVRQTILRDIVPYLQSLETARKEAGVAEGDSVQDVSKLKAERSTYDDELRATALKEEGTKKDEQLGAREKGKERAKEATEKFKGARAEILKKRPDKMAVPDEEEALGPRRKQ